MSGFGSKCLKSSKHILSLLDLHRCLGISHLKQIQSHLIVSGNISDSFAAGKLMSSFSNHPSLFSHACHLLIRLPRRSTYMWNSLIKALSENNEPITAIFLFKYMIRAGFLPNNYTFSFLIRAGIDLSDLPLGFTLHALSIKLGWHSYDFVQNGLIHLYSVCESIDLCRKLFDASSNRDIVTWTALINGYVKVGRIDDARELFDKMPERNVVSWSAMITGYTQLGFFKDALELFNQMQVSGFWPNHASIVGALTACASLGALDQGQWIHAYIDRNQLEFDAKLGTALIDMYAKCGCIEKACQVFEGMPCKDVFTFTSLISGLSNHGVSDKAIELFRRMENEGVNPNRVTFISVLTACSRMGLIEEGLHIFESMKEQYKIEPGGEHYGCMVELLGRAGMLQEAEQIVKQMSVKPDTYVLGSLLNACRVHGNIKLGEEMVKQLMGRGLDYSGVHTLLSNIYASANKWDGVAEVRGQMKDQEIRKVPGCSLIEVEGVVSEFGVGQRSHMLMEEIVLSLIHIDKHLRCFWLDYDAKLSLQIA